MITRCYLEITNVCNLNCVFCPKTSRAKHTLTLDEFDTLTSRLMGEVKFLYFHLMGEPFLHPLLPQFILMARQKGLIPILTTNGTLPTNGGTADHVYTGGDNDDGGSSSGCTVGSAPSYDLLVLFLGLSAVAAVRVLRRKDSE